MSSPNWISAKEAARKLGYAPEYVARLCRKGSLECRRDGSTWSIREDSLASFVARIEQQQALRAKILSRQFKKESKSQPAENVTPLPSAVLVAPVAPLKPRPWYYFSGRTVLLLAVAIFFAMTAPLGAYIQRVFLAPTILPPETKIIVLGSTTTPPLASAVTQNISQNTYPIHERTIERTIERTDIIDTSSFVTYDFLNSQLERIFDTIAGSSGGGGTLSDFSSLTASDIPDLSGVYLALTGGTLSGELVLPYASTTATSTLAGLALADLDCSAYNNGGALTTDSSGNVICSADDSTAGSGSPGGLNTYVQYNDGGSFGGDAGFTYNAAADRLTVSYASTTAITATTASTTNLIVSGISSSLLKTVNGVVTAAVAGTDYQAAGNYATFTYPFPSNATSTLIAFTGGLSSASTTLTGPFVFANATGTNATSTNLYVSGLASTTALNTTLATINYASTTAITATTASTTNLVVSGISGSLLKTVNGVVTAAIAGVDYAAAGASAFEYPFPSNATTTQIAFNGGATFVGATTTALAVTGSTTISSILNVGGAINANGGVVGNVTGDVSGNAGTVTDGVYTTTFNSLFDPRFITQLAATTSVASITTLSNLSILSSQVSDLASTIAAAYPFPSNATSTLIAFTGGLSSASTTLTGPFVFANATGTNATSTNLYVSGLASTTALNTTLATINYASTTMVTATTASTTALIVSGLNAASCDVKADTNGVLSCGTDSTGSGGAYPFALSGNATSTLTQFNAGLTAFASSTIGAGGQTTGLTISGGATTTGLLAVTGTGTSTITDNLNVQGQLKVGTGSIYLNGAATSTFSAGISTPSLTVTGVTGSLLKTMSSGAVVAAVAGTDYQAAGNYATFSYPFVDNATTSVITLSAGAIMGSSTIGILNATSSAILASTTLSGNTLLTHATTTNLYVSGLASTTALRTLLGTINYASTTMVTATAASTTNLVVSGLGSGAGNCLTTDSSGVVSTQSCGGSAYPFTAFTTFGTSTSATSSSLSTAGVFFASSTLAASQFPYASSTALTVSGQLKVGTGTGLALQTSGVFSTYAGTSCTNQAVTALNASGSGTCSSITDAYFSGTLGVSHGGTGSNLSATGGTSRVLMQTSVGGTITVAQLACSNLSNGATSCSTDTTNASNISSGTLGLARGGTGADLSATGGTSRVLMQTSSGATITVARLACSDLSNAATSCSTDATNASNISSGTLATGRGGTGVTSFGGTNTLLYTTSASTLSSITTGNNGVLVTSSGGVPSISSTLPSATQANITSLGTISSGTWQGSVVNPLFGGTGAPGTLSGFMYGNLTSAATAVSGTGSGDVVRAASPTISGDWVGSGSLSLSFPGFNVGTATGLCISTQGAYFSGTFTVTTCSSDERLKHDITYLDAPDSLEAIMSIKPARYVWNSDEASVVHAGFIAQDTLGFVPEAIGTTTGNPYYTFDNNAVLSYAVSALQEINRKVDRAVLSASSTATTTPEALADGPFAAATNALKSAALSALGALEDIAQAGVRKLGDAVYAGIGIFNKVFAETITATNLTASAASIDTLHTDYLCVGTTCVTADEFLQIMEVINGQTPDSSEGSNNSEDGDASSTPPTTDSDEDETAPDSQGTDPAADTPVDEAPVEPEVLDTPDTPAPAVEETP